MNGFDSIAHSWCSLSWDTFLLIVSAVPFWWSVMWCAAAWVGVSTSTLGGCEHATVAEAGEHLIVNEWVSCCQQWDEPVCRARDVVTVTVSWLIQQSAGQARHYRHSGINTRITNIRDAIRLKILIVIKKIMIDAFRVNRCVNCD